MCGIGDGSYVTEINPFGTCFYFDAATSIPFSWIDWYIYEVRHAHALAHTHACIYPHPTANTRTRTRAHGHGRTDARARAPEHTHTPITSTLSYTKQPSSLLNLVKIPPFDPYAGACVGVHVRPHLSPRPAVTTSPAPGPPRIPTDWSNLD